MKHRITIKYLKYRTDLNFEVNFRVNGVIGTIVTKRVLYLFGKWIVFFYFNFFLNTNHMPLKDQIHIIILL